MPLQRLVGPAKPAVTAAYVKQHARIDIKADDDYLNNLLIPAVVGLAEMDLRRSFVTQTWALTIDMFPGPSLMGAPWGVRYSRPEHAIVLEKPPVQSITSITYIAMDGTQQSLTGWVPGTGLPGSGTNNFVDLTYGGTVRVDDLLRVTPVFGQVWPPNVLPEIGSVVVKYVTGYGADDTFVPEAIKQWLAMNVATLYENRETVVVSDRRITVEELPYIDRLMDGYRIEI